MEMVCGVCATTIGAMHPMPQEISRPVVVAGCTGEIGNALVTLLLRLGHEVYAICKPNSWRLRFLPVSSRLHIVECDLFRIGEAVDAIKAQCGVFFHLGWHASYGSERNDPYGQVRNIQAALDAVGLAAKLGCGVFIGAGSQAQYGETEETLTPDTPMRPTTAYGAAKLCAEHMTRRMCKDLGLRHVWGRVLSVYGPCDGPYTLITSLMRAHMRGDAAFDLTLCGQEWDFLYAADAARAFLAMAERGMDGKAYCVASGVCRPLREYMADFQRALGVKMALRIGARPYAPDQRMRLCGDISALTGDTGFVPLTDFADGIAETWRWYKAHPEALEMSGGMA